jgi:hypothetical protein
MMGQGASRCQTARPIRSTSKRVPHRNL